MNDFGHILLVEDHDNDVQLTLSALDKNHLANEIVVLRDGAEALDYLWCRGIHAQRITGHPVVILLDIKMTRMGGIEVLRQIRANDKTRLIPVVMLSSSREESDLLECYRLGANSYVVKPVDYHEFVDAVRLLGSFWAVVNEAPPRT